MITDPRNMAANFSENLGKILHETGLASTQAKQRRYHQVVLETTALNLKKSECLFQRVLRPRHVIAKRHELEAELEQMCRGFKALAKKSVDFQILGQQPMDLVELMNWQRHKYSSYGWFQNTFRMICKGGFTVYL